MTRLITFRALIISITTLAALALVVAGLLVSTIERVGAMEWTPGHEEHAGLRLLGDLPVAEFSGDAAARGAQHGRQCGPQARQLLSLMRLQPRLALHRHQAAFKATLAAISADDRAEIAALAAAAGLDGEDLLAVNAVVDTQCSALVNQPDRGPLMVARNMDFFPAKAIGGSSLVSVVRGAGPRTYVNIGWPGAIGVVSGMNDQGVVACILLNHRGPDLPGAEPLQLRLRAILANESDLAGAVRRFAATPVGSSHYVLLADEHGSCVVWQERDGLHRDEPTAGWLVATNGARAKAQPQDSRGVCLRQVAASCPASGPDEAWMRQALTASYMTAINAQAMLFIPARREVQLARGTGIHPAAKQDYRRLELRAVLAGASIDTLRPDTLPAPVPIRHYTAGDGTASDQRG